MWVCSFGPHNLRRKDTHTPQGIDHTGVSLALADCGFLWSSLYRAQLAVPMGSLCQGILALIQVPITTNTTTVHRVFQCYRSKGPSGNRLQKEGWIASQWFLFIHPSIQQCQSYHRLLLHLRPGFYSEVAAISLGSGWILRKFQTNLLRVGSYPGGSWRERNPPLEAGL